MTYYIYLDDQDEPYVSTELKPDLLVALENLLKEADGIMFPDGSSIDRREAIQAIKDAEGGA